MSYVLISILSAPSPHPTGQVRALAPCIADPEKCQAHPTDFPLAPPCHDCLHLLTCLSPVPPLPDELSGCGGQGWGVHQKQWFDVHLATLMLGSAGTPERRASLLRVPRSPSRGHSSQAVSKHCALCPGTTVSNWPNQHLQIHNRRTHGALHTYQVNLILYLSKEQCVKNTKISISKSNMKIHLARSIRGHIANDRIPSFKMKFSKQARQA